MADLCAVADTFLHACGNLHRIERLFFDRTLATALKAIGDTSLDSAQQEFCNLECANNRRETVNRAATQLRVAFNAFGKGAGFSATAGINIAAWEIAYRKMYVTAMALILCYLYLGEYGYAYALGITVTVY